MVFNPVASCFKLFWILISVNVTFFNVIIGRQSVIQILWKIILNLTRRTNRRVQEYDINGSNCNSLEANSIVIPQHQRLLEHRRKLNQDESDNILIYGSNTKNQRLLVRVSTNGQSSLACLFLRLSSDKYYVLPRVSLCNSPRTSKDSFVGGGLRLRCIVPMRKWRISYVGLLEEVSSNGDKRNVNVKLGLFWTCSSSVHDLQSDISNTGLSEFFASQKRLYPWNAKSKEFINNLNSYVQAGNMVGSVSVEGKEKEVMLWGARKRSVERGNGSPDNHIEVLAYTKEGQMFHFGSVELFPFPKKLRYGFVVLRNSLSHCLSKVAIFTNKHNRIKEAILATGEFDFRINFGHKTDELDWPIGDIQNVNQRVNVSFSPIVLQDDIGEALVLQNNRSNADTVSLPSPKASLLPLSENYNFQKIGNEVVSLAEDPCHYSKLTGGKGSSLASLYSLKGQILPDYSVPNAIVVTSFAYEMFSKENKLHLSVKDLENVVWDKNSSIQAIERACDKISAAVGHFVLPDTLKTLVEKKLKSVCGRDYRSKRFAVRSSASGEDSEDMSAAGQMKSFLGLIGTDRIIEAIVQCWASQFSFTAVQYKKSNGQELNTPMAVVIQEMVAAEAAGVLFTCDPVTGQSDTITITANYGIGESVVSASAEPDTIVFQRDLDDNVELKSVSIGGKNSMTIMSDENGVRDSFVDERRKSKCSISNTNAKTLAEIATKIEEAYGCPVDLEWAIKRKDIFVLQARPITTLDKESDIEMMHETDSSLRSEEEFHTRANVGEVVNGAASHFGGSYLNTLSIIMLSTAFGPVHPSIFVWKQMTPFLFAYFYNQIFGNMPMFPLRFHSNGVKSVATESSMISGFGKILDDQDMLDQADRRVKYYPKFSSHKMTLMNLSNLLLLKSRLTKSSKALKKQKQYDLRKCKSARSMYLQSWKEAISSSEPMRSHCDASVLSSLANSAVMAVLNSAAGGEWSVQVYSDLALILSSCAEVVESATVPAAIEDLCLAIKKAIDVNEFKRMTKKAALGWLKSTKTEAGIKYEKFLKTHGHRGLNEFDVYRKTWELDETPLIQTLQEMVGSNIQVKTKRNLSTQQTIDALSVPLNFRTRLYLRILIPLCRRHVVFREWSKSLYVYGVNKFRHACWTVAAQMVAEGRLPDEELFFFMTHHEHLELFESRSPKIIQKALRRRDLFPKLCELEFPLFTKGYPIPENNANMDTNIEASFSLTGTPVSQGYTKGVARVAVNLEEAKLIKKGEILIAKGTDIGWSPYFPMLGGIATELGGLVSHGAVVAREYGLPCVVGVEGATKKFKSGDQIILDATKGIIHKIKT